MVAYLMPLWRIARYLVPQIWVSSMAKEFNINTWVSDYHPFWQSLSIPRRFQHHCLIAVDPSRTANCHHERNMLLYASSEISVPDGCHVHKWSHAIGDVLNQNCLLKDRGWVLQENKWKRGKACLSLRLCCPLPKAFFSDEIRKRPAHTGIQPSGDHSR